MNSRMNEVVSESKIPLNIQLLPTIQFPTNIFFVFCIFVLNKYSYFESKMTGCKDCRGGGGISLNRIDDALKLYSPGLRGLAIGGNLETKRCKNTGSCRASQGKCTTVCQTPLDKTENAKSYYSSNYDTPLLRRYEDQPWFRNHVVQREFKAFVDQLVTPKNIGSRLFPGPDDWEFKCHRARALIGPTEPCVWQLPVQDKCAETQYGINRDWRSYNEDKRMEASDISCGCNDEPSCNNKKPPTREWPPYLGKAFGSRYMAWRSPTSFMYPRARVPNYMSNPRC